MLFLLAKIVGVFANPGNLLLLLCVAGTLLCAFQRRRWGLRALYAGVGGFVLIAVLPIDRWMLAPLEDRFPQVIAPPVHVDGIIVLSCDCHGTHPIRTDTTLDRVAAKLA